MIIFLYVILFVYALILFWLAAGFAMTRSFSPGAGPAVPVTIIVCARNEAQNIHPCLQSILGQQYGLSKIELIVVDDASEDGTLELAENILAASPVRYKIISNEKREGKKESLSRAIEIAEHELIITRDADTLTHAPFWLQTICAFHTATGADLIIAPVALRDPISLPEALQATENNVLTLLAAGGAFFRRPFLCSGANLAFTKKIFKATNGYASHIHVASGDDVLFMEDVKKIPGSKIAYLKNKNAIVHTYPVKTFSELISQKVRWAAKISHNADLLNMLLAFTIFITNVCFIYAVLIMVVDKTADAAYFLFVILKLSIDILLLFLASGFIRNRFLFWFALPVAFIYPFYTSMISIAALFLKPKWKP